MQAEFGECMRWVSNAGPNCDMVLCTKTLTTWPETHIRTLHFSQCYAIQMAQLYLSGQLLLIQWPKCSLQAGNISQIMNNKNTQTYTQKGLIPFHVSAESNQLDYGSKCN